MKLFIITMIVYFLVFSPLVSAQFDFLESDTFKTIKGFVKNFLSVYFEVEKTEVGWVFIFSLIVGYLGALMIMYGFLRTLRIFGKRDRYYLVLSILIIAGMGHIKVNHMGLFIFITKVLFSSMGIWSVGIFALMFFAGTWFYYRRREAEWGTAASVAGVYQENIKDLKTDLIDRREALAEITRKIATTRNVDTRARLETSADRLKSEIRGLRDRLKEMAESYET